MKNSQINKMITSKIEMIHSIDFTKLIEYDYFENGWKLGEVKMIDGIENTKIIHEEEFLRFRTIIPPGASFGEHWHNCIEIVDVIENEMKDSHFPDLHLLAGDSKEYDILEPHTPYNPSMTSPTEITVDFFNPKILKTKLKKVFLNQ